MTIPKLPKPKKIHAWAIVAIVVVAAAGSALYLWVRSAEQAYTGRIMPGVKVAGIQLGSLAERDARARLETVFDQIIDNGFTVVADGSQLPFASRKLSPNDPDISRDLVIFHTDAIMAAALGVGRTGNVIERTSDLLRARLGAIDLPLDAEVDLKSFKSQLARAVGSREVPVKKAEFDITFAGDDVRVSVTPAAGGRIYNYDEAITAFANGIKDGAPDPIVLQSRETPPEIRERDVEPFVANVQNILATSTFAYTFEDARFPIGRRTLASWLTVEHRENQPTLAFDAQKMNEYFDRIAPQVEVEPRDARFKIEDGKVLEFQGSQEGIAIDREASRAALEAAIIRQRAVDTALIAKKIEPTVKTGEVNDLGIKEKLGTGRSNFSGSPRNRVKNIRNGINKLNGLLIKPGDEFSLLAALRPFTLDGGYLPELVIKGNKIIPEIGGGLCQIGSTAFRMAMKSGMTITARRSHSLVVRYYNDPSNGNPGTDATIYDPAPDFKFLNDTGNYLLITTEMNTATGDLAFTLWGTSDGRKGSYSPPVVSRWISSGPTKEIPTTDLAPGVRKCEKAHIGADASFTYTVELPNGEKKETLYTSHYRPLPEVCLVGVAAEQLPTQAPEPTQ